jgi:hypothetical protein
METHLTFSPNSHLIAFNRVYVGGGTPKKSRRMARKSGLYVLKPGGGKQKRLIGSSPPPVRSIGKRDGQSSYTCADWSRK